MNSILVVCEGNICRSPMAAALLAHALPRAVVSSRGLRAVTGAPAHPDAATLMRQRGLDLGSHRAVQLTPADCQAADLVLAMDTAQRRHLECLCPVAHGRIFRIGEYIGRNVPDPYNRPMAAFREALELIDRSIAAWLPRIAPQERPGP